MPSPNHKARASNTSLPRASSLKSTGAAIRRGDLHISDPIPVSQDGLAAIVPQLGPDSPQVQATVLQRDDSLPPRRYPPQEKNGLYASYALAESKPATRYNAPTQFHDPHESMSSGPSKGSVRRPKKEGGFRATMRKIFGTKKGRSPLSNISGDHHRSAPVAFNHVPVTRDITRSSMPISEITRTSALGSHSPFAPFYDARRAAESHDEARPSFQEDMDTHRRRNTLPSVVLTPREARALAATLGEVGMRPSSKKGTDGRGSAMTRSEKRRSRSAGALRETAKAHRMSPIQWRPREDEIKYWRTSVVQDPIPQLQEASSDARSETQEVDNAQSSFSGESDQQAQPHVLGAQQSFDFGPLIGTTQDESVSLEQRLTTLEVKFIDLEYAIAKLQGYDVERPVVLGKPPRRRSQQLQQTSTESLGSQTSHQQQTFLSSPQDSPTHEQPLEIRDSSADRRERPTSIATTLRPMTAFHQPLKQSPPTSRSTDDRLDYLMTIVRIEQLARQKLEAQVARLQGEVEELRSPPFERSALLKYPTPSPEAQNPSSISQRTGDRASAASNSRLRDAEREYDTDTDDGFMDVYETPTEAHEQNLSMGGVQRSQVAGMI